MIPDKVEKAFNEQIRNELQSAYLYLSMSSWCDQGDLPGMASWLEVQWREEIDHALRFRRHILDRNGRVELMQLEAPPADFDSPLAVFEAALENERKVTRLIHELYALVNEERDFASQPLLNWFEQEQIEEEATVDQIVEDLRRVGDSGEGLFLLDRELGRRRDEDHEEA